MRGRPAARDSDAAQKQLLHLLLASVADGAHFELIRCPRPSSRSRPPICFIRITLNELQAIVKFRDRAIAEREQLVYCISQWAAPEAVAPCVAVKLSNTAARHRRGNQTESSISMLEMICASPIRGGKRWCVIEQCVSLLSAGQAHDSLTERLVNQFGWCDLCQAFLATPMGSGLLEVKPTWMSCAGAVSDQQFASLLDLLEPTAFENLWLVSLLTEQADSHAANLMLRRQISPNASTTTTAAYQLVAVDTSDAFGERAPNSESSSDSSSDSSSESSVNRIGRHGYLEHDYPIMLELRLAGTAPSAAMVRRVTNLNHELLQQIDRSSPCHIQHAQQRAAHQLQRIQAVFEARSPGTSLRDIAFEVMPRWRRAWVQAEHLGLHRPLHELSGHLSNSHTSNGSLDLPNGMA